jgi:hypothetical protein
VTQPSKRIVTGQKSTFEGFLGMLEEDAGDTPLSDVQTFLKNLPRGSGQDSTSLWYSQLNTVGLDIVHRSLY